MNSHDKACLLAKACDLSSHPKNMLMLKTLIFYTTWPFALTVLLCRTGTQMGALMLTLTDTEKQNSSFRIGYRHFLEQLLLKTKCTEAIQTLYRLWLVVNKCLQAIFVPKRLLRWAPLLFLGDRTDCLLCVAVGHFCLFSLAVFPLVALSLSSCLWDYFCSCCYLSRVKERFLLL